MVTSIIIENYYKIVPIYLILQKDDHFITFFEIKMVSKIIWWLIYHENILEEERHEREKNEQIFLKKFLLFLVDLNLYLP